MSGVPSAANYDVTIIGAGLTGLVTSLLIAERDQTLSICLVDGKKTDNVQSLSWLGMFWPSLNDPPTRSLVAHGRDMALHLQKHTERGVENLFNLMSYLGYSHFHTVPIYRYGFKDFEVKELKDSASEGFGLKEVREGVFIEQFQGIWLPQFSQFYKLVEEKLNDTHVHIIKDKVHTIDENGLGGYCELKFKNNSHSPITSATVVLTCGSGISQMFPRYKPILLPMTDILSHYFIKLPESLFPSAQFAFRAANGHISGLVHRNEKGISLSFTGPRFLLPMAGAGLEGNETFFTEHLKEKIFHYHSTVLYPFMKKEVCQVLNVLEDDLPSELPPPISLQVGIDIHPCDELPLLGEYGNSGKIFGNAGWLASGLSAGLQSANVLADILLKGECDFYHPRMHPRRFFKVVTSLE